ncbi:hypothetical protein ETD86_44470, partial [Nonomuraea turkmeniaca]
PAPCGPRPPRLPADFHPHDQHRPGPHERATSAWPWTCPWRVRNIENTRAKLKRLVSLGIIAESEPGLFAQPHP